MEGSGWDGRTSCGLETCCDGIMIHSLFIIHWYVCGDVCTGVHMCALLCWAEIDVGHLSCISHHISLLRQCYSLNLKFITLTRLLSRWASGLCLSCCPPAQVWAYRPVPDFSCWTWRLTLRSHSFHSRHSANWAISPAPNCFVFKEKMSPPPQIFKRLFLEVQPIMWLYGTRSGLSWIRPLNTKASLSFRTPVLHCFATGIVQGWHIAVSLFRDYPWLESQFKVMSLGGAIYLSWLANMKKKVLVSTWEHSWGLSSCHFCLHIIGWGLASLHHNQPVSSHPNSFTHLLMLNSVTHSN